MSEKNWPPLLIKRQRARHQRRHEDPSAVFKTFVELLAQLRANARAASHPPASAQAEKS